MKYFFFVQGEGRGHLSQAITLKDKLESRGHQVTAVFVGINPTRKIPEFFSTRLGLTPEIISGPVWASGKNNKRVSASRTIIKTILSLPKWRSSLKKILRKIKEENPDALINFYEPLSSWQHVFVNRKKPFFIIGHQFMSGHPIFDFPKKHYFGKYSFLFYNFLLTRGKVKKIALSFTEEPDLQKNNLFVCPPLIKKEILEAKPQRDDYSLTYFLNHGYSEEIISWCQKNPNSLVEAFCDHDYSQETVPRNLHFHLINDQAFARALSNCASYASTAGFESICEAAYLDKDILMVPTQNHYEQLTNAIDAKRAGIANSADHFDFNLITEEQKTQFQKNREIFKNWVNRENNKIFEILENL
ncbi:MAG: hypothetical protein NT165_02290 [Candidatus Falkowbacteria bacterium]|nr:hypothetical protein [Candidatus Falkowbacteria bacterium]